MTRSVKRYPVTGVTTARSEKAEKVLEHRAQRVHLRSNLARLDYERAEIDDRPRPGRWFAKDGRQWHTGSEYEAEAYRK